MLLYYSDLWICLWSLCRVVSSLYCLSFVFFFVCFLFFFLCVFFFFVFFQAEDGIRDLVRSRGLGDVYKRQAPAWPV